VSISIVGLSGSLRAGSVNTALLRAASKLAPAGVSISHHDYGDVSLYNGDLDVPESVLRLRAAISSADGVLLAVPEYNYSLPGVLKNAIDWASRPAYHSPFRDKPVGVVSAAASFVGGARGQQHTKNILLGMGAPVFPWPELLVGSASKKFADGELNNERTTAALAEYVASFAHWVYRETALGLRDSA
jgi:chromate reductase